MPERSSNVPRGVRRLFRLPSSRARMLRELDEEVQFHFAMRIGELRALGMSAAEAEAEAQRRFGDTEEFRHYSTRRAVRKAHGHRALQWLTEWGQDVRFAGRQFAKAPGFVFVAVLMLALGVGANTAIFTVVNRLLLAPLPYPDGNQIVMLTLEREDGSLVNPGRAARSAWRERARSFEAISAVVVDWIMVQDPAEQDTIPAFVTSNHLRVLGVRPALGREFTLEEERAKSGVAMITYGLWQRRYGGRADVLGSTVRVDGRPYVIVGVTPQEAGVPMSLTGAGSKLREATPSIWLPASLDSVGGTVFARLRPGISARQASGELQSILDSDPTLRSSATSPRGPVRCCARVMRAQDFLDPAQVRAVQILFVAVGVLLLIACANVASLLMSRAWARRREFAVRRALGAGRARLARLVLTESMALALFGGLMGAGVAWLTLRIIIALRPPNLVNLATVQIDGTVLLWCVGISVVTGLLFGAAPALFAGGRSIGDILRSETRAGSPDTLSRRLRSTLIVGEISMSIVLLVGAGLLVRSFVGLQRMPLGFDPHGLVAIDVLFPPSPGADAAQRAVAGMLLERVSTTPGVIEAAIGTMPGEPYRAFGDTLLTDVTATGRSTAISDYGIVPMTPNYFRVARIALAESRSARPTPSTKANAVEGTRGAGGITEIFVNGELARRLAVDGRAEGMRLRSARVMPRSDAIQVYTVVGISDDVRIPGRRTGGQPLIYRPPIFPGALSLLARVAGSPRVASDAMRRNILDADPNAVIYYVTIGDDYIRDAMAPTRFAMALLAAFAIIALILSAVGLYGVISYSVTQRTRELGVRVALGANPRTVMATVIGGGLRLAGGGVAIGAVAALAAAQVLESMLYGVSPADPPTFIAIALVVATIALVASYVPARRVLRIDPTDALRAD